MKYERQMQASHHGKQFEGEVKALVHTDEFAAIAKYIEAMKKNGPTPQIKAFAQKYKAAVHKLKALHHTLVERTQHKIKLVG